MTESEADRFDGLIRAGRAIRGSTSLFRECHFTPAQTSRISDHGLLGLARMTESDADRLDGLIRAGRAIRGSSFPVQ